MQVIRPIHTIQGEMMKRFLFFVFMFLLTGGATTGLFADHAKVLPKNVGRFYFAPTYQWGNKAFDGEGSRKSTEQSIEMFNIGLALEHGVTNWVTAALQWTPGNNIFSDIALGTPVSADLNDMGDLFVGAKIQIIGAQAPVRSEVKRFAFAVGFKAPLTSGPDFTKEYVKMTTGEDFTASKIDKHALGAAWRLYYDHLFTKKFYLNLYNETVVYIKKGDLKNYDMTAGGIINNLGGGGKVNYGYDLTFEVDPNYTFEIAPKTDLEIHLPVNYKTTPTPEFDLYGGAAGVIDVLETGATNSRILTARPTVGIFFKGWALPIEFKLSYFAPVRGKNTNANNTINAQIRIYYKI